MILTLEKFKEIVPSNQEFAEWYSVIIDFLPEYEIDTVERISMFLAQCCHESGDFRVLKENLNYSAESLMRVWPQRFQTIEIAKQYARNPEKIANKVYANRMGNGDEASGDGWKYSGKGIIQLTGKSNYAAFAKHCGIDLDQTISYILTKKGAVHSACWFWKIGKLNKYSDVKDIVSVTKIINGGYIGLEERKIKYEKVSRILNV